MFGNFIFAPQELAIIEDHWSVFLNLSRTRYPSSYHYNSTGPVFQAGILPISPTFAGLTLTRSQNSMVMHFSQHLSIVTSLSLAWDSGSECNDIISDTVNINKLSFPVL